MWPRPPRGRSPLPVLDIPDGGISGDSTGRAPQCVDFELSRSVDEPACHVLRITWTSAEDHLHGFRGGDLFPEFLSAIRPYVGDIEEMRHYERTAVAGSGASVPSLYEWAGGRRPSSG